MTTWKMLAVAPRAMFDPNRINTVIATQEGCRRPEEIITLLRQRADERRTAKALDTRNSLFDVIVHSQDIALPLSRDLRVPVAFTRRGLQRVWEMGWPFKARKKLGGFTPHATDTDGRVGDGPEVTGPALALLLLLTGRFHAAASSYTAQAFRSLKHRHSGQFRVAARTPSDLRDDGEAR